MLLYVVCALAAAFFLLFGFVSWQVGLLPFLLVFSVVLAMSLHFLVRGFTAWKTLCSLGCQISLKTLLFRAWFLGTLSESYQTGPVVSYDPGSLDSLRNLHTQSLGGRRMLNPAGLAGISLLYTVLIFTMSEYSYARWLTHLVLPGSVDVGAWFGFVLVYLIPVAVLTTSLLSFPRLNTPWLARLIGVLWGMVFWIQDLLITKVPSPQ
ncbi:MAG: hypothetical protein PWP23_723 [Candidatus Sumerlaeota bacterium]|nr:hypothetical protein [Candidatus Sumerlaeota bacterium]